MKARTVFSLFILSIGLLLVSCSKSLNSLCKEGYIKKTKEKVPCTVIKSDTTRIKSTNLKGEPIQIIYLGCGGFAFQRGNSTLLIDPYFSPVLPGKLIPSMLFGSKTLQSNEENIKSGLASTFTDPKQSINSIWVSHSHYDHLMDVPYVYNRYPKEKKTKVYGSASCSKLIEGAIGKENTVILDSIQRKEPIPINKATIKVLPILSSHAPHYRFLGIPISFFGGKAKEPAKFPNELSKTKAGYWKLGETYAFLIDFLNEANEIEYRIFVQSSASYPSSTENLSRLAQEHPIDLAILGAASYKNVKKYPKQIYEALKPEKIIVCHWEDFFVPYEKSKERVVRATNIKKFIAALNKMHPYQSEKDEGFIVPIPGTSIYIDKGL